MKRKRVVQALMLCAVLFFLQAMPLWAESYSDPPPQTLETLTGVIERIAADRALTINGETYYPSADSEEGIANLRVGERATLLYTTDQKGTKNYVQVTRVN